MWDKKKQQDDRLKPNCINNHINANDLSIQINR